MLGAFGTAAQADQAQDVLSKITAARAHITSMQIVMTGETQAYPVSMTLTVVHSDRFHEVDTAGPLVTDAYAIGDGYFYHGFSGLKMPIWQKSKSSKADTASILRQLTLPIVAHQLKLLPDRIEGFSVAGVFESTMQVPPMWAGQMGGTDQTVTCSYDRATYFLRTCAEKSFTMTFSHYNDPELFVELPPEARAAPVRQ
jgi:hypothetical protein